MRIERITLQTVRLRLREPFRISSGETFHRRILLLRMDTDAASGRAECVAGEAPNYSYETYETALWALERHLVPASLGLEFEHPGEVPAALDRHVRGHAMAKAAIEMAAWDAFARARGEPLAAALGGQRERVPAGVSIGLQPDLDTLITRIQGFVDQGYARVKLKIEPGRDVDMVGAVRRRFPDLPLTVDANAAYRAADLDRLCALDAFGLLLIEQPFPEDDLLLHAQLQRRMTTPICLDESITSAARCREAIALRAGLVVNIKPGRVGGHTASLEIHDVCRDAGWPVWIGGMLESGIGRAHNVALASLPNVLLPGDTSASRRYWDRDVVRPEFTLNEEGTVTVPAGPGIGVDVDEDFLAEIEEERREFTA
ncbi:MAG TPA: o-succinylbenzoate synthase [Longimicrobiales bacterium]|nr:o-succinylbenzoate synthase [Longimicrobiales bacterium]